MMHSSPIHSEGEQQLKKIQGERQRDNQLARIEAGRSRWAQTSWFQRPIRSSETTSILSLRFCCDYYLLSILHFFSQECRTGKANNPFLPPAMQDQTEAA